MYKSKLINLISEFDAKRFKELGLFIHSDLNNTNQKIRAIYVCMERCFPDLNAPELEKESVYPAVFPGEPFDDRKLRAMMSLTAKLVEHFLMWEQLQSDHILQQQLLTKALRQRKDSKLYKRNLEKQYTEQDAYPYRDIVYYFNQHLLEEESYNFANKKKERTIGKSLNGLINHLDIYYLANQLKYNCELQNRQNILGEEPPSGYVKRLEILLNATLWPDIPIIKVYQKILFALRNEDSDEVFEELILLLQEHASLFPRSENKIMFGYAMNFCIKKINTGHSQYLDELFRVYKLLLKLDIIYEGRYISQWDYKNIVTVGLRLNEVSWTEAFIENYKRELHPRDQDNAYMYNLANLNYFKKDYKQTMLLLQQVDFTDDSYLLSSRSLLLKSYYELEEYEALYAQADSFKLFLRRNKKLSSYQQTIYKNLIRQLVKLSRFKASRRKLPKEVVDKIAESNNIADKTWLMNKIEELSPG